MVIGKKTMQGEKVTFLLSAIDPKHYNSAMRNIMVKEGIAYATDGKRLHVEKDIGLLSGEYAPMKAAGSYVLEPVDSKAFPDVDRIMEAFKETPAFTSINTTVKHVLEMTLIEVNKKAGGFIDLDYLAFLHDDCPREYSIAKSGDNYMFRNCTRTVVIAGFKGPAEEEKATE